MAALLTSEATNPLLQSRNRFLQESNYRRITKNTRLGVFCVCFFKFRYGDQRRGRVFDPLLTNTFLQCRVRLPSRATVAVIAADCVNARPPSAQLRDGSAFINVCGQKKQN